MGSTLPAAASLLASAGILFLSLGPVVSHCNRCCFGIRSGLSMVSPQDICSCCQVDPKPSGVAGYEGLERLYDRYRQAGLVVIGFPSGDFGGQELSNNKDIAEFCTNTFNVRFPMVVKTSVRGSTANPVFAALIRESGTSPKWNFYKYLIGRDGRFVKVYSSMTSPDDRGFVQDIERSLKQNP